MKIHQFNPIIYPRLLWIAVGKDPIDGYDGVEGEWLESSDAFVIHSYDRKNKKGGVFMRFESLDVMSAKVITHESIHAAMDICDYCDIRPDNKNQEYLAYLAGWVAQCCEEVKEREKLTKKKKQ